MNKYGEREVLIGFALGTLYKAARVSDSGTPPRFTISEEEQYN